MDPYSYVPQWHDALQQRGWWHSFELPDGSQIEGVNTVEALRRRLAQFPIPQDLRGKRVLDIGAWDGWFSFEMERRGAEVLAIDRWENPRFHEIRGLLGSAVEYREMDVHELSPANVGSFDIVVFLGVLYHVRHPLLALERVCAVCRDMAIVESYVMQEQADRKLLQFFEYDELGGQFDNWFAPTVSALQALCRAAGFARVEVNNVHEYGAALTCHRKWETIEPTGSKLLAARNAENYGVNFRADHGDYIACCLNAAPPRQPIVDEFGVPLTSLVKTEAGYWQANFMLPPGLSPGWHSVRIGGSNAVEIAVDVPLDAGELTIDSVSDGVAWTRGEMSLSNGFLSLWIRGLPRNADAHNVRVQVDGNRQAVQYVGTDGQVNVKVTSGGLGPHDITVSCGPVLSAPVSARFIP